MLTIQTWYNKNTIWNVIFYVAQNVSMYNPNIVLIIEHEDKLRYRMTVKIGKRRGEIQEPRTTTLKERYDKEISR